MFWKGADSDDTIWFSSRPAGDPDAAWQPQQQVTYQIFQADGATSFTIGTSGPPTATRRDDAILLAWKGAPGDSTMFTSLFKDGEFGGQIQRPDFGTATGPALVQLTSRSAGPGGVQTEESVIMAWRGAGDDKTIWFARL